MPGQQRVTAGEGLGDAQGDTQNKFRIFAAKNIREPTELLTILSSGKHARPDSQSRHKSMDSARIAALGRGLFCRKADRQSAPDDGINAVPYSTLLEVRAVLTLRQAAYQGGAFGAQGDDCPTRKA